MNDLRSNASDFHSSVLKLIKETFPDYIIANDKPIKVGNRTLYIDIFIKNLKLAIECDGDQHDSFNKFFHGDAAGFVKSKENDMLKTEYCKYNNITLIRIKYKEQLDKQTLLKKIAKAIKENQND